MDAAREGVEALLAAWGLTGLHLSEAYLTELGLAVLAFALGGILKGALGAGVPLVVAPVLGAFYGVPTAVAVLVVSNLLTNVAQAWQLRAKALPPRFLLLFCGGGMAGVVLGTWLLVLLPVQALSLLMVGAILAYVTLRLARPTWVLPRAVADRFAGPVGLLGGFLQGTTGISAAASISYLNAMRLPREAFIATISAFFVTMTAIQIPALYSVGVLTVDRLVMGLAGMVVALAAMPLGTWLGRRASPQVFDRVLLGLLCVIAAQVLIDLVLGLRA